MNEAVNSAPGNHPAASGSGSAAYANPMRRVAAYLIDQTLAIVVILTVATVVLRLMIISGIWGSHLRSEGEVGYDVVSIWTSMGFVPKLVIIVAFLVSYGPLYFVLMESSPWRATLGKRWLRVYVTGHERQRIGLGTAAVRWIVKAMFPGVLAIVQLVVVFVSRRRKAIHDIAAKTVVLAGRTDAKIEPWRLPLAFGVSALWIVATFVVLLS